MKSVTKLVFPFGFVHTLSEGFIKSVLQSQLGDLGGPPVQFVSIFMQFSANTMPNNRLAPLSGVGAPPFGNPGSATVGPWLLIRGQARPTFHSLFQSTVADPDFLSKGINPILIQCSTIKPHQTRNNLIKPETIWSIQLLELATEK